MKNSSNTKTTQFDTTQIEYLILAFGSMSVVIVFLVANLIAFDFSGGPTQNIFGSFDSFASVSPMTQAESGSTIMWRQTSEGWQDVSALVTPEPQPSPKLEKIHPLVWTGVIVFSVLGLMVVSSKKEDLDRLFNSKQENNDQEIS